MKVLLTEKKAYVREPIKEIKVEGSFDDYFNRDKKLKEELLLKQLPKDFLPFPPASISIMVEDYFSKTSNRVINTKPLKGLSIFKEYDNEFDKYILELCRN